MGGVIIFAAVTVPFIVLSHRDWQALGVFGAAIACALLGFADDYTKIVKRRSLGLRARTKLVVTIAISVGLWWVATKKAHIPESVELRFADVSIDLGPFYIIFIYLVVAGTTTAVNFTDGLDGLAAGCAAIVLLAYIGITFISGDLDLAMIAGCLVGACIGFLWFNSFPASIFMGDTGSLGLGGAIAGLAIMTRTEVLLILLGGIFVIEVLSVVIQVFSFQTFRRRVFLDGADPPPLRAAGLVGDQDHPALLDRGLRARRDRLRRVPAQHQGLAGDAAPAPLPTAAARRSLRRGRAGPLRGRRGAAAARARGGGDRPGFRLGREPRDRGGGAKAF